MGRVEQSQKEILKKFLCDYKDNLSFASKKI